MKKLFFFATFSLILLLFGCDNNSANNPVSPNSIDKTGESVVTINTGTLNFDKKLIGPNGNIKNDYQADGNINYTEEILKQSAISIKSKYEAKLSITITASLTDENIPSSLNNKWKISAEKEALVNLPPIGRNEFKELFSVVDNYNGLVLVCTFEATQQGLLLKNIELQSQRV